MFDFWDRIRPLIFDGTLSAYEFQCKILAYVNEIQAELQNEIDNIVVTGGGITAEERAKLNALTNDGINNANHIIGFAETMDAADDYVARAKFVRDAITTLQNNINKQISDLQASINSQIDGKLLPTVTTSDNGKVAKVIDGNWGIGNDATGGSQGDTLWTQEAVQYFKTVIENLIYKDASTGQTAANKLLAILEKTEPEITLMSISAEYSGESVVVGSAIQKSDFSVTAEYSDGSRTTISDFTFTPNNATTVPQTPCTINYAGKTATVNVPTIALAVDSLTGVYIGETLTQGATLNKSMFTVTANYNNGTSTVVQDFTFSPDVANAVPVTYVVISYSEKTVTVSVSTVAQTIELESISATYNKGSVVTGTELVSSDFTVTAYYSNGTNETVSGFSIDPNIALDVPVTPVTVSYLGKTTSVDVQTYDEAPATLTITNYRLNSGVARLLPNDVFTEKGVFEHKIIYNTGREETINSNDDLTISPASSATSGNVLVTATITGTNVSTTINLTIEPAPYVNSINVVVTGSAETPAKFDAGTVLTVTDFTIVHFDQYGSVVTSGWERDYISAVDGNTVSGGEYAVTAGEHTITVTCLTDDARDITGTVTIVGVATGATSSGGNAFGTATRTFKNITQDVSVNNIKKITFTSTNFSAGNVNQLTKLILTLVDGNWVSECYKSNTPNTGFPPQDGALSTVVITDGKVTSVEYPASAIPNIPAGLEIRTVADLEYTMEVTA